MLENLNEKRCNDIANVVIRYGKSSYKNRKHFLNRFSWLVKHYVLTVWNIIIQETISATPYWEDEAISLRKLSNVTRGVEDMQTELQWRSLYSDYLWEITKSYAVPYLPCILLGNTTSNKYSLIHVLKAMPNWVMKILDNKIVWHRFQWPLSKLSDIHVTSGLFPFPNQLLLHYHII